MSKKREAGSLDKVMQEIKKKYGEDSIMMLEDKKFGGETITTGSIGLDHAIGIGGYPRGGIVEIYGPESSGKTTLALTAISEAQKRGWGCAFIDLEHALDPTYARKLGVDTGKIVLSQPESGEDAMQIVDTLVRSGEVQMIVLDSIAMLVTKAELEGEIEEQKVAAVSRLLTKSLRVLVPAIEKHKVVVLFINQIRASLGMTFMAGPSETTPGGKALKFMALVRLDIRKTQTIKKGEDPVGSHVKIKVVKNKVGPPLRVAQMDILYNEGFSREGELVELGEKHGILAHTGAGYSYGDHKLGRGFDSSREFLKEHPELAQEIRSEVLVKMQDPRD